MPRADTARVVKCGAHAVNGDRLSDLRNKPFDPSQTFREGRLPAVATDFCSDKRPTKKDTTLKRIRLHRRSIYALTVAIHAGKVGVVLYLLDEA